MSQPFSARPFAIGAIVYAVVSILWIVIGIAVGNVPLIVTIGLVILALLLGAIAAVTVVQSPEPTEAEKEAGAALGKWFGIIFTAEGVLIGVGSGVLAAIGLPDWIVVWVAAVVGLHFFPLGYLFQFTMDYVVGAAIIALVFVTLVAAEPAAWATWIAIGSALCLNLAGWARIWISRQKLSETTPLSA